MTRSTIFAAATVASLFSPASAQLESCTDIGCPVDSIGTSINCSVDGSRLNRLGVANFTSAVSSSPIAWTVGYVVGAVGAENDTRVYYLGSPRGLDLGSIQDVTGCALFFTGVESGLHFPEEQTGADIDTAVGTCAEAMGQQCVTDLMQQARDVSTNMSSSGIMQCSSLAQTLSNMRPLSCGGSGAWGDISATTITGSDSPPDLQLNGCNPTINSTYEMQKIASFPQIFNHFYEYDITPLLTVFAPNGNETVSAGFQNGSEVHLNCMKALGIQGKNFLPQGDGNARTAGQVWVFATISTLFALLFIA